MKLIKSKKRDAQFGVPASLYEEWIIEDEYEIHVDLSKDACLIGISQKGKGDITLEVARFLGINTKVEDITFKRPSDGSEIYLVLGIDCVGIEYVWPENYKELLKNIEKIINEKINSR